MAVASIALIVVLMTPVLCPAQRAGIPQDGYTAAVSQPKGQQRVAALEDFLTRSPQGQQRIDALEVLAWEYNSLGRATQAASAARELLRLSPQNPLAIAILGNAAIRSEKLNKGRTDPSQNSVDALAHLNQLQSPAGIPTAEFMELKREVYALLSGAAGMKYLEEKNYASARIYLVNATAVMPNDTQYVYSLALAELGGDKPDMRAGFWDLARAVVLSEATPSGPSIAQYAAQQYAAAGGSSADWSRYVAAARVSLRTAASTPRRVQVASAEPNTAPPLTSGARPHTSSRSAKERAQKEIANKTDRKTEKAIKKGQPDAEATLMRPSEIEVPARAEDERPRPAPFPPGEPVSLGILIEAADTQKHNREAIVQGLSYIVRRLRPKDEAFIISYGDQLVFEQDLTQNYRLLENAMDSIKPASGSALYDAVAFAAGHLARIANNKNQVLLVISDGRAKDSKESPTLLASSLSNVRIFCIGMEVDDTAGQNVLRALADRTGGAATFISAPAQFETAALTLARTIYGAQDVIR